MAKYDIKGYENAFLSLAGVHTSSARDHYDRRSPNTVHGKVRLIVIHSTWGGFKGSIETLRYLKQARNPKTGKQAVGSAHYIIRNSTTNTNELSGEIYQLIDERLKAFHVAGVNDPSIGIEMVDNRGDGNQDLSWLTNNAYTSLMVLINYLCKTYNIPKKYLYYYNEQSIISDQQFNDQYLIRPLIRNQKNPKVVNEIVSDLYSQNRTGIIFHRDVHNSKFDPIYFKLKEFIQDVNYDIESALVDGQGQGNWQMIGEPIDDGVKAIKNILAEGKINRDAINVFLNQDGSVKQMNSNLQQVQVTRTPNGRTGYVFANPTPQTTTVFPQTNDFYEDEGLGAE